MNELCEENTKPVAGEGMCPALFCVREQGMRMKGATGGWARLGPLTSSLTASPPPSLSGCQYSHRKNEFGDKRVTFSSDILWFYMQTTHYKS